MKCVDINQCARVTRLTTNHAPIGEYCCHFFPREDNTYPEINACPYGMAQPDFCKVIQMLSTFKMISLE